MKILTLTASALLIAPIAANATQATATTALNVRAAPDISADVNGVLQVKQEVTIEGCLEDVSWCMVSSGELKGWASGNFLVVGPDADPVPMQNASGKAKVFGDAATEGMIETDTTARAQQSTSGSVNVGDSSVGVDVDASTSVSVAN